MKANSEYELADLVLGHTDPSADPALCLEAARLIESLASATPAVDPPGSIRARLLAQISREPRLIPLVQYARDAVWKEMGVSGLTFRVLFEDRIVGRTTLLLKLEAGARIPVHHHEGTEEVFLLEGDLQAEDGSALTAGDYQRSEPGSLHQAQWSVGGCIALMVAPSSLIEAATQPPQD